MSHGVLLGWCVGEGDQQGSCGWGPLATSQHGSDRIQGCWRGWEQGWRAQCALSHLPGVQEGQKWGNLGEKGDEEEESLDLEA